MQLTTAELALLRQENRTNLWLSIYRPKTLLAARVSSGTYSAGETTIPYDTVSTGTYLGLYNDITVLVGSQPNTDDFGRIRMRSATGTYAIMAENAINWTQRQYLTFIDQIDIQAIYPQIVQDPNNAENVIFYKDSDIAYSNQNSIYGTFPNAGPHRAGFLELGTGTFFFSATGTYNVNGDSLTYNWAFENGTPTGSTSLTPGTVRWGQPGHNRVRLRVTSSTGAVDETFRYVSLYHRPNQGTDVPTLRWELQELSGSRGEGGYTASFKVFENLGDVQPNAIVVIFADTWYGGTKVNLGGNALNNSSIVFVGYILSDSIKFNYKAGYAEFTVGSSTEMMKAAEGFSVSCESKATPSTWFQLQEMTIQKAVYHYLRWHSTVLKVSDFQYIGDDRLVQFFDSDRSSLYDAVNSFIREGLIGEVVSDRQSKIWAEITPVGYENPVTALPLNFNFQKHDWIGEPDITERRHSEVSFIEMGGIVYYGVTTNQFLALLSNAPSLTPLYRGKSDSPYEGLIILSQGQLNQLAGNYLAQKNSKYKDLSLNLPSFYANLDIAPQEKFLFNINENDTYGRSLIGLPFRQMSMDWNYDSQKESFIPNISFEQIASGTAGQTLIIPPEPPEQGYSYPALSLPPIPPFPGTGQAVTEQVSRSVLMYDDNIGMIYTTDFDNANPVWQTMNGGIDSADLFQDAREFFITPSNAVYLTILGTLYYAPKLGDMFVKVIDDAWYVANYGTTDGLFIAGLGYNPSKPEEIAIIAGVQDFGAFTSDVNFWIGNAAGLTRRADCDNVNGFLGHLTFDMVNRKWVLTAEQFTFIAFWDSRLWRFNETGSSLEFQVAIVGPLNIQFQVRAADTGRLYLTNYGDGNLRVTDDNGATIPTIGDSQEGGTLRNSYACDPTGQYLMGDWTTTAHKGKSSDFGYSWVGMPTLPPGSTYVFAYCGGAGTSSQWIAARGVVRYSPNFGLTWINKEGNLLQIAPIPSIRQIFAKVTVRTL